ncbi:MAG: quinone-dependent dihydroorotate dehydrogenase [Pseudomonadota bacterium]
MIRLAEQIGLKALSRLDPESAHRATITALKSGLLPPQSPPRSDRLTVRIGPLTFPNPVGIAAGFDKDAEAVEPVFRLGFGFTEIGSVTPRPQPGNPKPRVFRLPEANAVINRYGFNSQGHVRVHERLLRARSSGIVGINVGANKDSTDRVADYVAGIRRFADCASYFTVNISSPNTPGLRDLQARAALQSLLDAVLAERERAQAEVGRELPVFLKIAPDLTDADLDDVCGVAGNSQLDGLIVSNTTLSRAGLPAGPPADESGGLSGAPLFERATIVLAKVRRRVGPGLPLIGVGGITDARRAWDKVAAGATLLQVYTGLVYQGPSLLIDILKGLDAELAARGLATLADAVGIAEADWADRALPPT